MARDPLHGWTLAGLESLAAAVTARHRHWWPAGDIDGQHAAAWDGITDLLLTSAEPPSRGDLAAAGLRSLSAHVRRELAHAGAGTHGDVANAGAGFAAYWDWYCRPVADLQERVTEYVALPQILGTLPRRQRQALHALAASGNYATAAAAMGLSTATFGTAVHRARVRFYELWHEGEVPARQWRRDRHTEPAADPATEARRLRNRRASARYRQRQKAAVYRHRRRGIEDGAAVKRLAG